MVKSGFTPRRAAAIEAVGSTGGQLMPPVMGASAFIMAEFLQVPYGTVCIAAAIPALLYYMCLFFHVDLEATETLARMDADGRVEHLQPPEYHGDPLGGGVLCFHHFGWDLLAAMREAGFSDAHAVRLRDPSRGWPEAMWMLRARR